MDHLPQHDRDPIRVPFVAESRIYKPDEFFTLPKAFDCTVTQLIKSGPRILPEAAAPAFLQSWLFFSLIAQVLQRDIDAQQFLRSYLGDRQVNTGDLIDLFKQSIPTVRRPSRLSSVSMDESERWNRMRASLALDEARKFVLDWCSDNDHVANFSQEPNSDQMENWSEWADSVFRWQYPELCLSFGILGETLERYRRRLQIQWSHLKDDENNQYRSWHNLVTDQRSWGFSNLLRQRMHKTGWCPREIRRITMTAGDLSSMYYMSSFEPVQKLDHASCTLSVCRIDPWTLAETHTTQCPNQGNVAWGMIPNQEQLRRIIKDGNIPLLRYNNQEELSVMEFVVPTKTSDISDDPDDLPDRPRFVAISHAWSDGLSAKEGKGLPKCQLNRLRDTMQKSSETKDLPFWIDSLCVPREPLELQNKAFQDMGKVYSHAFTVLVLDSTLRSISRPPETLESIVRINTGLWSKRMWTLPEGVRAKNLHFDFKNGLLSSADIQKRYEKAKRDPYDRYHHVYKAGWLFTPYIFSMRHQRDERHKPDGDKADRIKQLPYLWQAMQWREASRPEDETLCLARLLDIDPLPLLKITESNGVKNKTEQRMAEFLSLLDQRIGIAPGMIFLPGPKLNIRGFTWAPSSWMRKQSQQTSEPVFVPEQRLSFLTRNGLHVQYPGVQLHTERSRPESTFWVPTARNLTKWYRIQYIPEEGADCGWERIWQLACSGPELPAIIRSRFGEHDEPEIALLVRGVCSRSSGGRDGLCDSVPNGEEVKWVHSLCRVWIQWETDHTVAAELTEKFRYNIDQNAWGETLDAKQRWVVDGLPECWA